MMELIVQTLEATPLLALFLAIGLGYAIGQINVGGLSLGVGGVLFSALAIGAIAPKSVPPGMVGTIGLILLPASCAAAASAAIGLVRGQRRAPVILELPHVDADH